TRATPRVFWAVIAVMAETPKTPKAVKVLRSAWIPAPPPLSEPATVMATGTARRPGPAGPAPPGAARPPEAPWKCEKPPPERKRSWYVMSCSLPSAGTNQIRFKGLRARPLSAPHRGTPSDASAIQLYPLAFRLAQPAAPVKHRHRTSTLGSRGAPPDYSIALRPFATGRAARDLWAPSGGATPGPPVSHGRRSWWSGGAPQGPAPRPGN